MLEAEANVDNDIKDQITIRMTKTIQQDVPPHYSIVDRRLVQDNILYSYGKQALFEYFGSILLTFDEQG